MDRTGQEGFSKAILQTIRGGEIVLDLGTGTGIHALFASQAGAKRVYAVDQHEVIELARQICKVNGYEEKVCFLHRPAAELELPEQVDLIVAHHGLPELFSLLIDARDRFLKSGGTLIPASVELFCAPLDAPEAYEEKVEFWAQRQHKLSFMPVRSAAVNTMHDWHIAPGELLGEAARLTSYDLSRIREPKLSETVESTIGRRGILHGVGLWLNEWLTHEIVLSAAPPSVLSPELWPASFLPIETPTTVEAGDTVRMKIETGTAGWGTLWNWEVAVKDRQGRGKARFTHSTFYGMPLSQERLRRTRPDFVPMLSAWGTAQFTVLSLCDGKMALAEIEQEISRRHPALFPSPGKAAAFVAKVINRTVL